jgi:hypothetical protein
MRKILVAAFLLALVSCNSEKKEEEKTAAASTASAGAAIYPADYSAKFEMGDAKHSEAILALWKAWDDGDLLSARASFADSTEFYFRDGTSMAGQTDTILKQAQAFRNSLASVKSTVHAYFPVKSTDKGDDWVCIWGNEVSTDKMGKVDSVSLQETWRFNKDGKVNLLYQFGAAVAPAPK